MPNNLWHSSLLQMCLVKCAHSYTELKQICQILCDIRHVANRCVSKVLTPPWFAKLDLSDMQNIRHFRNVSCEMCTQLHRIETSMPNSLWHSSLLKNSDFVFTYADTAAQVNTKPALFSNTVGVSKSAYRPKNYLRTLGEPTKLTYADTVFLRKHTLTGLGFPLPPIIISNS